MPTTPRPTETPHHDPTPHSDRRVSEAKAAAARRGLHAVGLVVIVGIGALTAVYALRPGTEPLEPAGPIEAATVVRGPATTADAEDAREPEPAVLILTEDLFPSTHALEYAGRQAQLDGMMVTETVGNHFAYVRPATRPNELPLLVDLSEARDVELSPSKLVSVRGTIHLAADVPHTEVLTERQRERLDQARIYLEADTIVAPPES